MNKPNARGSALDGMSEREMRLELEARIAEAGWLKEHYDRQLREAYARIEDLEAEVRRLQHEAVDDRASAPSEEFNRLQVECARLSAAEQRYLERIEELKGARAVG